MFVAVTCQLAATETDLKINCRWWWGNLTEMLSLLNGTFNLTLIFIFYGCTFRLHFILLPLGNFAPTCQLTLIRVSHYRVSRISWRTFKVSFSQY